MLGVATLRVILCGGVGVAGNAVVVDYIVVMLNLVGWYVYGGG